MEKENSEKMSFSDSIYLTNINFSKSGGQCYTKWIFICKDAMHPLIQEELTIQFQLVW